MCVCVCLQVWKCECLSVCVCVCVPKCVYMCLRAFVRMCACVGEPSLSKFLAGAPVSSVRAQSPPPCDSTSSTLEQSVSFPLSIPMSVNRLHGNNSPLPRSTSGRLIIHVCHVWVAQRVCFAAESRHTLFWFRAGPLEGLMVLLTVISIHISMQQNVPKS